MTNRFWNKVDKRESGECWPWLSTKIYSGYGMFWSDGGAKMAHRIAYILAKGAIPAGLEVMHTCDNRECCNPAHLKLGTHKDNMADAAEKLRLARGEAHPHAKLTDQTIADIRLLRNQGVRVVDIAAMYGIDNGHVSRIANRKIWRHVP
jgi:hypothetical protein